MIEQNPQTTNQLDSDKPLREMGILEQLNLPPSLVDFLRKNQRNIWLIITCVVSVVVVVSLYSTYIDYQENKAATVFSEALAKEDDAERRNSLDQVVQEYDSTATSFWASMELAALDMREKKNDEALNRLVLLNEKTSASSSFKPLVLYKLATLEEEFGEVKQAINYYNELAGIKHFESIAHKSLGGIYEGLGDKEKAVKQYEEYLLLTDTTEKDAMMTANSGERDIIRSRLSNLKK